MYTWSGQTVGFVNGESVYTNGGHYVARLHNGWIRGSGGNAIAFTDGASGGPLPPMRSIPSIKSVPSIPPLRAIPSIPPIPAIPTLSWSGLTLHDLF
ncbi:4-fold beta flower protein [Bradyrhizobium sp. Pa8]|uniref:4-fold beta flower protein n=1 Tax=Bradyrhizobium sp. Pa8 TaxID=3386552 RepID=UPI00403F0291